MLTTHAPETTKTVVFKTDLITLAAAVCEQLENAGYPVKLSKVNETITLSVLPEIADDAKQLLYVHTQRGEHYFYRG